MSQIQKRKTNHHQIITFGLQRTAVHTKVPYAVVAGPPPGADDCVGVAIGFII
jgi:hypothetical protein